MKIYIYSKKQFLCCVSVSPSAGCQPSAMTVGSLDEEYPVVGASPKRMEMELGGIAEDGGQEELRELYVHMKAESQGLTSFQM